MNKTYWSPHSCQCLVVSLFGVLPILTDVQWHLSVVLIFNSLMTYDVEVPFHMLTFYLHISFGNFLMKLFVIVELYIGDTSSLSDMCLANILSAGLFILLKCLSLRRSL